MRWSLLASGFLLTALLRFAFGHSEAAPEPRLEPLRAPEQAPAAPPPERLPFPTSTSSGPSILSLLEIGPAETVEAAAPTGKPAPQPLMKAVDSVASTDLQELANRQQRRLDRWALRAAWMAVDNALDSCAKPQLLRNPKLTGKLSVTVTVGAQPGIEHGVLLDAAIDAPTLCVPLFAGCIRASLAAATLPKPASQIKFSYRYTLENSSDPAGEDESDEDDSEEPDAAATSAAPTTP